MNDLLLVIDIGNTHTVLGIYQDDTLVIHWRLSTSIARTEDESWIAVKMLCDSGQIPFDQIKGAIISSVVPNSTVIFKRMLETYFHLTPVLVSSDVDLGIQIHYEDKKAVGADRLCNAVGGFAKYSGPLVIVDFGTATTFDIITKTGDYRGGIIAPGVETSAVDLWRRAARLYRVELKFPDKIVGQNTESSMQAGIMYGAVEMIDGLVRRLKQEIELSAVQVISTGGLAPVIMEKTSTIQFYEPYLTLDGMRLIFKRIHKGD